MQLDLSPEAVAVVERLLATGIYRDAAEVVEESLPQIAQSGAAEADSGWLRQAAAEADAGGEPLEMPPQDLRAFLKAGYRRSA